MELLGLFPKMEWCFRMKYCYKTTQISCISWFKITEISLPAGSHSDCTLSRDFRGRANRSPSPGKFEFLEDLKFWITLTTNSDFHVNLSSMKLQILNSLGMLLWLDLLIEYKIVSETTWAFKSYFWMLEK